MGPALLTADEVPDVGRLRLETRVNGELRQDAALADLIFDIPTLIETISAGITLEPGDVIATGPPEGVGIGFDPPASSSAATGWRSPSSRSEPSPIPSAEPIEEA
jgi:2-keto-4-pentenoate hydratase/2-oxohepta-3-ene-1,7-dioic acid hydratase in catechol pathway